MKRAAVIGAVLIIATSTFAQVTAKNAALSTAHPLATRAGLAVLQRGGTAADAAVAVAFALAVVHPQAGNLGGGGFAVYYDAQTRGVWTLDFRETAPSAATRTMFAKAPPAGALAAGIPGTVAGLDALHAKFGTRPWKELLAPAIALAKDGPRKDAEVEAELAAAKITATLPPPELATTLQSIADNGARDFYSGEVAKKLVDDVRAAGGNFGYRDLREYTPLWRAPMKFGYGAYDIYTVAPPSGGGLVIGETLNILARDDLRAMGFQSVAALHLFAEAARRAFIDRDRHAGDPMGTRIPYRNLLSEERARGWRASIDMRRAIATAQLTAPRESNSGGEHTTHFTIADARGNVVSLTTTLGDSFGSGLLLPHAGFFLNNAMTGFTEGANALEPGKRPASPLAPTIVLRGNKPFLALGTRGGAAIATTVLQVFLNVVVYGKSLSDAVGAPHIHHDAATEQISYERGRLSDATLTALNEMGHGIDARDAIGDVHAILFENGRLIAVADRRRGGAAGGY